MANNTTIDTYFAPAKRADKTRFKEGSTFVQNYPLFQAILDSVDGYIMVLNPERQVLAMNKQLIIDLKLDPPSCIVGDRPGEVLKCIHAAEGPNGCGTSKHCETCGAVISILNSQKEGAPIINECLATVKQNSHTESLEFRVRATPVTVEGYQFTVLVFHDISGEKRRAALERTFFHDILNTVGGLMGWGSLLQQYNTSTNPQEVAERIVVLSKRLKHEIEDQRRLIQAEQGTLSLSISEVAVPEIFNNLKSVFTANPISKNRVLEFKPVADQDTIEIDSTLLLRILTNMIKNALEAVQDNETVQVWFERDKTQLTFSVQNPGVIPAKIALQIFNRSFSTKAAQGRGIGTYSMKLFGERYLGGKVGFESTAKNGTRFYIQLPIADPKHSK